MKPFFFVLCCQPLLHLGDDCCTFHYWIAYPSLLTAENNWLLYLPRTNISTPVTKFRECEDRRQFVGSLKLTVVPDLLKYTLSLEEILFQCPLLVLSPLLNDFVVTLFFFFFFFAFCSLPCYMNHALHNFARLSQICPFLYSILFMWWNLCLLHGRK
jgi:hypothetical protein